MIYLYKKTHNKTGLKYLGKTIRDPFKYHGSGLYWKRHLKEHGYDITTEILFKTEDKNEFKNMAMQYSIELDIVNSKDWANFREETGHGGFSKESSYKGYINGQLKRSVAGGKAAVQAGKAWNSDSAKIAGSKGGEGNKGKSKPISNNHRLAISVGVKKNFTEETRNKISESAKNRKNIKFSDEAKINISNAMKKAWDKRRSARDG